MNLAFCGGMGSGKTTAMMQWVREHCHLQLFYVRDRGHCWTRGAWGWQGREPESLQELRKAPKEVPQAGVLVFHGMPGTEVAKLCSETGGVYVDDEADTTCAEGKWLDNPLRQIIHEGRHLETSRGSIVEAHSMLGARRFANLPTDISSLFEQAFIFNSHGARNLQRLLDDDFIKEEDVEIVQALEPHHFKHWPTGQWLRTEL